MKEFNKTQELLKLKIKQNKNTYIKRVSIILSCVILVIGVLYFTFAKFESNKSYTLIQGKLGDYSSGDLTIGAIIDGVSSSSFPENNGLYVLSKIECKNKDGNVNVEYDENNWRITGLDLTSKTTCVAYFDMIKEWNFSYTGNYQEFTVPVNGKYKIELWGAQGGSYCYSYVYNGGAYTSGDIILESSQKLYIYVGQSSNSKGSSAYNGGGIGYASSFSSQYATYGAYPGGGGTDVRLVSGVWNNAASLRSRIMVSAGSGGRSTTSSSYNCDGSHEGHSGGGLIGYGDNNVTGGDQISGGTCLYLSYCGVGSFGQGGNSIQNSHSNGGGGGGYFGGGADRSEYRQGTSGQHGGGGGSSFISGHTGCVAITSASDQSPKSGCTTGTTDNNCSIHYSGLKFTNTKMIDGKGYPWTNVVATTYEKMPKPEGGYYDEGKGHTGNGYARITYLGE